MEIRIVPIKTGNKSKYYSYFVDNFTKKDLKELKQTFEQIKGNPVLGVMIDVSNIKKLSNRKNKINERGYVDENGQIKAYGMIAKALASFLSVNDITGVYFTIKEQDDKVYVTFKDISVSRSYKTANEDINKNKDMDGDEDNNNETNATIVPTMPTNSEVETINVRTNEAEH